MKYTANEIWGAAVLAAYKHIAEDDFQRRQAERERREKIAREKWLREKIMDIAASDFADQLFDYHEDPTRCSTYFLN
jgi:hypothetical protein